MNWLIERIAEGGDKIAVIFKEKEYTYTSLYEKIKEYSAVVKTRFRDGDVVAIVSDYSFESIALFFALHENKNIIVPITTKVEVEINNRINVAGSNHVIHIIDSSLEIIDRHIGEDAHPLIKQLRDEQHSGLILFSSGSTGAPKAMIHNLDKLIDTYQGKKGKRLVFLIFYV